MPRLNIASPEFQYDADDPEGFRAGMFRFGPKLGAKETGASVYELPPGQSICPYHYEYGEEEWLLVLEGHPTLRTPEGEEQIGPLEMSSSSRRAPRARTACTTAPTRRCAC